ncbi:hypothetical protein CDD81_5279 [Ophiocordyceps australis]|uniref:F-box domain-containing protein n=1 Tax=Ophiocordyceps australis TaxID=1399860 RepID=A0A2C5YDY4_9HYPO|nr:hypothetical protein CDD81_5279 [Ophiocordyceps australis]
MGSCQHNQMPLLYATSAMDKLPTELLLEIVAYLPPSSRKNARLASRRFYALLWRYSYRTLPSFFNPASAIDRLEETLAHLSPRPACVWSPRCGVPDQLPVPQSFLLAAYAALQGRPWRPSRRTFSGYDSESSGDDAETSGSDDQDTSIVTVQSLSKCLGRKDITEDSMRQAMFRYALYLSYLHDGKGEAPQLWVFKTNLWADKA